MKQSTKQLTVSALLFALGLVLPFLTGQVPQIGNMLLERIKNDQVFKDNAKTVWVCRNCGHVHVGEVPPEACPVCKHPKAYFERKATNY